MSDSQNTTVTFGANSGSSGEPTPAAAPAVATALGSESSSTSSDEQDRLEMIGCSARSGVERDIARAVARSETPTDAGS
eukprot:9106735-Alexandrium_andersonii.AAC.1